MRKFCVVLIILSLIFFNACSLQEKVTPMIIVQRLCENTEDLIFDYESSYYDGSLFIIFAEYKNDKITLKMQSTKDNVISKISLYTDKNNQINELLDILISVYSPNENSEKIINELIINNDLMQYSFGKEYTYSLFTSENGVYFEIFNNNLYCFIIPELTLKPNDKSEF